MRRRHIGQHHPISIRILKRLPDAVPIRVVALDGRKPGTFHALHGLGMSRLVRQIKDKQVVLGGSAADLVAPVFGEFEVVSGRWVAQHHSVKAGMVGEAAENLEPKAVPVEGEQRVDVIGWSCNADVGCAERHDERVVCGATNGTERSAPHSETDAVFAAVASPVLTMRSHLRQ